MRSMRLLLLLSSYDLCLCQRCRIVPSCFMIYDLELLSLSFDFVFSSEIFKYLSFRLDRLCHLAILCLDQHAHTLHHLESLLTISLDRLNIFEGRSCISEFLWKSDKYGYIKNHKKIVKNEQARTRESEEYKKKPKDQSRSQKCQASVKD
ncbi:hypothetical protein Tco_1424208, partial [Tanacetum coccineum]